MKDILLIICFFILFCCGFFSGYRNGEKAKQQEIENRAKQIEKDCYTNEDVEIIIFNEKQL